MDMKVTGNNKENLQKMGFAEEDQNYQSAVVARLMQKAVVDADTSAIRLLGELTGDLNRFGPVQEESEVVELVYPTINLPNNGRDRKNTFGLDRKRRLCHPQQILSYMAALLVAERHTHCCLKRYGTRT